MTVSIVTFYEPREQGYFWRVEPRNRTPAEAKRRVVDDYAENNRIRGVRDVNVHPPAGCDEGDGHLHHEFSSRTINHWREHTTIAPERRMGRRPHRSIRYHLIRPNVRQTLVQAVKWY